MSDSNNTPASALDWGTLSGVRSESGLAIASTESDWYRFTLAQPGRYGDAVQIDFSHHAGDLDLMLWRDDGVDGLAQSESVTNRETIHLTGLAAGSYLLEVYGYDGATNPDYQLTMSVAIDEMSAGTDEAGDNATSATSIDLIDGVWLGGALAIGAGDEDWYRFTLAQPGAYGDAILLTFSHRRGDLDLALWAGDEGGMVASSAGVRDYESIDLSGLAAGDYLLQVYGFLGAANPDYDLLIETTPVLTNTLSADRLEANDSAQSATPLGLIEGRLLHEDLSVTADDADWFSFRLDQAGQNGDEVSITFEHRLGDLDLTLYDASGLQLRSAAGVRDSETLSLAGLAAGDYLFQVYGYAGASNPNYSLQIAVAPPVSTTLVADPYEHNDTLATATDLRTLNGDLMVTDLSIGEDDSDWFHFTLGSEAVAGDALRIDFNHALGDLDLALYDASGSQINRSTSVNNHEQIGLTNLAAGDYYVEVYGYGGATNPNYTLSLTATLADTATSNPTPFAGDLYEDNDSAATAYDLRTLAGELMLADLSIEAGDDDWFAFTLATEGGREDWIGIDFSHAVGDLDLALYDGSGTVRLSRANGTGDQERISLEGLMADDYLLHVYGYQDAANRDYTLTLSSRVAESESTIEEGGSGETTSSSGDRFELNDSATTATDLRTPMGVVQYDDLSISSGDQDWYRFTLDGAGRLADEVTITFNGAMGDLDLALYDSSEQQLATSESVSNRELISLNGLAAGDYLLQVYGYAGASNPDYTLTLTRPEAESLQPDRWEQNDSPTTATEIRESVATLGDATLTAGDQDWFRFNLSEVGGVRNSVTLTSLSAELQLNLYDAQQNLLTTTTSAGSDATTLLSLQDRPAGDYLLELVSTDTATEATYTLRLDTTAASSANATAGSWTLLLYGAGDNNLEAELLDDINEMELALPDAAIQIGVLADRIPGYSSSDGNWSDTRVGIVSNDSNSSTLSSHFTSWGERDSGSSATLTDFINWGTTTLPADNYALVIWNHGGGPLAGSAWDDSSGNNLSLSEVSSAINASTLATDGVDLLGFDACLMASIEQVYEANAYSDLLIFSELTEPGDGWDYTGFLNRFTSGSDRSSEMLATAIVDSYASFYGRSQTLSAVDSAAITAVGSALDQFVATLLDSGSSSDWNAITEARQRAAAADAGYDYLVDIGSFMSYVTQFSTNTTLNSAALAVNDALDAALVRKGGSLNYSGLTLVFPEAGSSLANWYGSDSNAFLQATRWDELLTGYYQQQLGRTLYDSSGDPVAANRSVVTIGPGADFAEHLNFGGAPRAFANNDLIQTPTQLGTLNVADFIVEHLTIDSAQDVDWFHFDSQTDGMLTITLQGEQSALLQAQLYDAQQQLIATSQMSGDTNQLDYNATSVGDYLLEISAVDGSVVSDYALQISHAVSGVGADFAEREGGNNSAAKAWQLGDPDALMAIGTLHNLTWDRADQASGDGGGDWFQVDASRLVAGNVSHLVLSGEVADSLTLRLFNTAGEPLQFLYEVSEGASGQQEQHYWLSARLTDLLLQVVATEESDGVAGGYQLQIEAVDLPADQLAEVRGELRYWHDDAPLVGANITLADAAGVVDSGRSGEGGEFDLGQVQQGAWQFAIANQPTAADQAAVTRDDALAALRMAAGIDSDQDPNTTTSPYAYLAADADGDGRITSYDALLIMRAAASGEANAWQFVDASTLAEQHRTQVGSEAVSELAVAANGEVVELVGVLQGDVDGSWGGTLG